MKVLIAEDIDSISIGIQKIIEEFDTFETAHAKYCDEAFLKFKKAKTDKQPFDLVITDLSFKSDYKDSTLKSGTDLITAIRNYNSTVPIIVYSIEDKVFEIKNLFKLNINAYVLKGRNSTFELIEAIKTVLNGNTFISKELSYAVQSKNAPEIDEYDIALLYELSKGYSQPEISKSFENQDISPSSVSAIEKRINKLKVHFQAKNTIQLIALVKDLGII